MLEVVVVVMVLAIAVIPFLQSFRTFSRSVHRSSRHAAAVFVGQAVLEQLRRRVAVWGNLDAEDMEEMGATVVWSSGQSGRTPSKYFASFQNLRGQGLHGISKVDAPELYRQLEHFTCDIQVLRATEIPEDTDGDGTPEDDLLEVGVTVRWQAPAGGEREVTLWTMLTTPEDR